MKLVDANWSADKAVRDRIQTDLDTSMMVEAAAGAGKTTQLVGRLVAVLAEGRSTVDRIVAVTFTRKAAGELKLRLREDLEHAATNAQDPEVRQRLENAIAHLEETRIGTIHSFCADLLRQRPVEAGVDPGFAEVADDEGPRLFAAGFDRWIQGQLEEMPEGLRRALSRLALESGYQGGVRSTPLERLRDAGWRLAEWRDYPATWQRPPFEREPLIDRLVDLVARLAGHARRADSPSDPLRRGLEPIVLLDTWIRRAGFELQPEADPSTAPEEQNVQDTDNVLRFPDRGPEGDWRSAEEVLQGERRAMWSGRLRTGEYDALEARLLDLRRQLRRRENQKKGRGKFAEALPREQVIEERDLFVECLDHFQRVADADLAALLQRELRGVQQDYERIKQEEARLDFSDLLLRTRDMLVRNEDVRRDLQESISHLFVDEVQDTDPVQAEVLLLLSAEDPTCDDWRRVRPAAGKLFLVGDPKQSIYRFRRADVRLYESIKDRLGARGVAILELGRSFRSNEGIQRFVNAAFAEEMDGDADAGRPSYLPLGESRKSIEGQPSVVALPVPRPYKWRYLTQRQIEESLPEAVTAYCQWLLEESGWRVEEGGQNVPIRPRHVCILFRRYLSWGRDVTRPYTQGLEDRGITHLLIGARTFHQREEVETLRAALKAIEWPGDDLSVFATLRGSLFSFSDELLLRFRAEVGAFSVFSWRRHVRATSEDAENPSGAREDLAEVGSALDFLLDLHRKRNRRAIVETVEELLDWTRARAGFALRPAGHQVLANLERVCELARSYELGGGRSFRGFVRHLDEEASKPSSAQAPVVEEGADGVRIMTVHAAKGLEFPVVILADMTANLTTREPDQAVDSAEGLCAMKLLGCAPLDLIQRSEIEAARDRAEGMRVAYVAATRARDLLVVPGVGDEARPGWLEPLNKALYPAQRRGSEPAAGCPGFGESSVLERPMEVEQQFFGGDDPSVRPGRHRMEPEGGRPYDVVWWDPAALPLEARAEHGLSREALLADAPTDDKSSEDGERGGGAFQRNRARYEAWKSTRERRLERASTPSRRIAAVTELEVLPPGGLRPVGITDLEREPQRPSGPRFGDLVHTSLRLVDYQESGANSATRSLVEMNGRILGATQGEIDAATSAITTLLDSDLGASLRTARRVWRELPIGAHFQRLALDTTSTDQPIPVVVDAVIDLLLVDEEGRWSVIDFKTDAVLPTEDAVGDGETSLDRYRRQLSWYGALLEHAGNVQALAKAHDLAPPAKGEIELLLVRV